MTTTISNPPYNMKWKHPFFAMSQSRFAFGLPPESNANYAFIQTALSKNDKAVFLLPNGVLTTNDKEESAIRRALVENNYLEAVIQLPNRMFESTSIPTSLLIFNKHKTTANILMMDAKSLAKQVEREQRGQVGGNSHTKRVYKKKINILDDEAIDQIMNLLDSPENKENISKVVSLDQIKNNDFIIQPTRYIDIKQKKVDCSDNLKLICEDLQTISKEKAAVKLTINRKMAQDLGILDLCEMLNKSADVNKEIIEAYKNDPDVDIGLNTEHVVTLTNSKVFKVEVKKWDKLPDIIQAFAIMWAQMSKQYNDQENIALMRLKTIMLDKYFNNV